MQDVDDSLFVLRTKFPFVEITSNFGWLLKIMTLDSMKINGHLIFFFFSCFCGIKADIRTAMALLYTEQKYTAKGLMLLDRQF